MKLIIFGATGSVGIHLVTQALRQGHTITAFTRNTGKFSSVNHPHLNIFGGDIRELSQVENAIKGHDCVFCVIGDGSKGRVRAKGTKNIVMAMKKNGINRIICQTTLGLGESRGNLDFFWKYIMFGLLLKRAFSDHQLQEKYLFESGLDYTIVRPAAFTDGEITNRYKIGFHGNYKNLNLKISRADVADFMLRQLNSDLYSRKAVSISN